MLLSEIHHRVKNNLQNIIGLLSLYESKIEDPHAKSYMKDVSGKIHSIALIHEQLYEVKEFEFTNMEEYFGELTDYYNTLVGLTHNLKFEIDAKEIKLNIETAIPLGVVCAELISNSIKYAETESDSLNLSIKLKRCENEGFCFEYRDNGKGYADDVLESERTGMGLLLIKSMSRQLMADLEIENQNGAVTRLIFKEKEVSKV